METLVLTPETLLPHRAPMLLIDRVVETDYLTSIVTETTVKKESVFLEGHFPNYPLLPGVILIEMMFQAGGILMRLSRENSIESTAGNTLGKAVKINSATFFKEVFAGSVVKVSATKKNSIFKFSTFNVVAEVGGVKVCEAEITVSL